MSQSLIIPGEAIKLSFIHLLSGYKLPPKSCSRFQVLRDCYRRLGLSSRGGRWSSCSVGGFGERVRLAGSVGRFGGRVGWVGSVGSKCGFCGWVRSAGSLGGFGGRERLVGSVGGFCGMVRCTGFVGGYGVRVLWAGSISRDFRFSS